MLSIISPAKKLDFNKKKSYPNYTQPKFINEAWSLARIAAKLSKEELGSLMSISENLASLNYERFQNFLKNPDELYTNAAAFTFNGDTYVGLDARNFTSEDLEFAQGNLRILSGLYGVLRPLDQIQPYRLEMGSSLANPKGDTLYDYWKDKVSNSLKNDLMQQRENCIINLASIEYAKVIDIKILGCEIITPQFLEKRGDQLKNISFFSKTARGSMAKFIIKNRLNKAIDILQFELDNYRYEAELSSSNRPVFIRERFE